MELANLTSPSLAEVIDQAPTGISGSEGPKQALLDLLAAASPSPANGDE